MQPFGIFIILPSDLEQLIIGLCSKTLKICFAASADSLKLPISGDAEAKAIEAPIAEKNTYNLNYLFCG